MSSSELALQLTARDSASVYVRNLNLSLKGLMEVANAVGGTGQNAAGGMKAAGSAANEASGHMKNMHGSLFSLNGMMNQVISTASGMVIAMAVMKAMQLPGQIIGAALDATAAYERLGLSLENLVAVEMMNASGHEEMIRVGQQFVGLSQKEQEELEKLRQKMADYSAQGVTTGEQDARRERDRQRQLQETSLAIKEQELRLATLTQKWGANGIDTQQAALRLQALRNKLGDLQNPIDTHAASLSKAGTEAAKTAARIAELEGREGRLVDVTKKVIVGQMTMNEAMAQAGPRAKELLQWTQQLAIYSPFDQDTVANTLQTAMGYGMASDMAQELTEALVDFSAGTGRSQEQTKLLGLALGQVWAKGKLTGEEMRQLTNAGMGVELVAKAAGLSMDEFASTMKEGEIDARKLIPALIGLTEERYEGAAKRQATAWAGLMSTWEDIKKIGLREFFESTFSEIQPYVAGFVEKFSDPAFMDSLNAWGKGLGETVGNSIKWLKDEGFPGTIKAIDGFKDGIKVLRDLGTVLSGGLASEATIKALDKVFGDDTTKHILNLATAAGDAAKNASEFNQKVSDLNATLEKTLPSARDVEGVWGRMADDFRNSGQDVDTLLGMAQAIGKVVGALALVGDVLGQATFAMHVGFLKGLAEGWSLALANLLSAGAAFWGVLELIWKQGGILIEAISTGTWEGVWLSFEKASKDIQDLTWKFIGGMLGSVAYLFAGLASMVTEGLGAFVNTVITGFSKLYDDLVGHSIVPDMIDAIVAEFASLPARFDGLLPAVYRAALGLGTGIKDGIVSGIRGTAGAIGNLEAELLAALKSLINTAIDAVNDAIPNDLTFGILGQQFFVDLPDNPLAHLANGARNFAGGWALVGERGPELVNIPRMANVYTARETRTMINDERLGIGAANQVSIINHFYVQDRESAEVVAYRVAQIIKDHQ